MTDIVIIIVCVIIIVACFAIFGAINVISSSNKGNNWGKGHMRDLGLIEDSNDPKDNLKPF